jgi:hypothetical protein
MYISGSYFKSYCRYRIGDYLNARTPVPEFSISDKHWNSYVFCKTEFLSSLYDLKHKLPDKYVLLTHNSDINIFNDIAEEVLREFPSITMWYTQNMMCYHPRVRPLPIGLANPKWEHGNVDRFKRIADEHFGKEEMVYVNFNIQTNPEHRSYCLEQIGLKINTEYPSHPDAEAHNKFTRETQDKYLTDMAKSYFVVSPFGNGVDCHKTWEALYMGSIPIVIKTPMSETFRNMGIPMILLNDWSEYRGLELTEGLYKKVWGSFDPKNMDFYGFVRFS